MVSEDAIKQLLLSVLTMIMFFVVLDMWFAMNESCFSTPVLWNTLTIQHHVTVTWLAMLMGALCYLGRVVWCVHVCRAFVLVWTVMGMGMWNIVSNKLSTECSETASIYLFVSLLTKFSITFA
jgi:hypothetical protein